jgi:hypothetical protein
LGKNLYYNDIRRSDGIVTYIARSTNSIDCKPYYDCFKGAGSSGQCEYNDKHVIDERYSDTCTDYRENDKDSKELFSLNDEAKNGFKFKFNRSLNSCQIKNKRKINTVY